MVPVMVTLFTAIPALFMTAVTITYILAEPRLVLGRFIPYWIALTVGACLSAGIFGFYLFKVITRKDQDVMIDVVPGEVPEVASEQA